MAKRVADTWTPGKYQIWCIITKLGEPDAEPFFSRMGGARTLEEAEQKIIENEAEARRTHRGVFELDNPKGYKREYRLFLTTYAEIDTGYLFAKKPRSA